MHEFEQEVTKLADCINAGQDWPLYREGETVDQTVKRIYGDDPPDWVIDRERDEIQLLKRNYKVGAYISDLHHRMWLKRHPNDAVVLINRLNRLDYDAFFMKVQYIFKFKARPDIFMKKLNPRKYFLPYSVDPEKYFPSDDKDVDVSLIGNSAPNSKIYPLRSHMASHLPEYCNKHGLTLVFKTNTPLRTSKARHVTNYDGRKFEDDPQYILRKRYADTLGRTRFFLFCGGKCMYPVQKYFEGMASGCVCLANEPIHAKELGFIDGETYVKVNEETWEDKLNYYLENPEEANKISRTGRELVLKRHTHEIRAKEFIKMLKEHGEN